MGLCNAPDVFQEKMSTLFAQLQCVRTHVDNPSISTNSDFNDHLKKPDITPLHHTEKKVKLTDFFFWKHLQDLSGRDSVSTDDVAA